MSKSVGATFPTLCKAHDYIIETEFGEKLKEKGLCFIRRMTDATSDKLDKSAVYKGWQQSWVTEEPDEAEAVARSQGLQVEWLDDGYGGKLMQTRYCKSAFEYIDFLDRNMMITSIADDGEWFDNWPALMDVPQEERRLGMLFGNDTLFTLQEKQEWTAACAMFVILMQGLRGTDEPNNESKDYPITGQAFEIN